ncbi:hypothetical protein D3C75_882800 [compost metagenome]
MQGGFILDKCVCFAHGEALVLDLRNGAVLAVKALIEGIQRISHQSPVQIFARSGIQEYQADVPVLHGQHQPVRYPINPAFQLFGGNILGQLGSIIFGEGMQPDYIIVRQPGQCGEALLGGFLQFNGGQSHVILVQQPGNSL